MLILSRKRNERIMIGDDISIMVVDIRGDQVQIIIEINVHTLRFSLPARALLPRIGEPVRLGLEPETAVQVFYKNK